MQKLVLSWYCHSRQRHHRLGVAAQVAVPAGEQLPFLCESGEALAEEGLEAPVGSMVPLSQLST